jgi:hypothetical protein
MYVYKKGMKIASKQLFRDLNQGLLNLQTAN